MGRSQNINIHKSLEEIDSLMDGFEGFTISVEEVIAEVVRTKAWKWDWISAISW